MPFVFRDKKPALYECFSQGLFAEPRGNFRPGFRCDEVIPTILLIDRPLAVAGEINDLRVSPGGLLPCRQESRKAVRGQKRPDGGYPFALFGRFDPAARPLPMP